MSLTRIKNYFRITRLRKQYLRFSSINLQREKEVDSFYNDYRSHGLLNIESDINLSSMPKYLTSEDLRNFYKSDHMEQTLKLAEMISKEIKNIEDDHEALNEFVYEMN